MIWVCEYQMTRPRLGQNCINFLWQLIFYIMYSFFVYHINFFFYPKMLCQINAIKVPYIISILDRSSKLGLWSYFTFGLLLLRVLNPVFRLWIKEPVQELSCLGEIPNVLDFRHQHPLKMHKLNIFFANKVTFVGNKFCKQ